MRPILSLPVLIALLSACGGPSPSSSGGGAVPASVASAGGICPSPDPARDGPLVDAIRTRDAAGLRARIASDPGDTRAAAALAVVTRGTPDPNEAACFAPYL